MIGNKYSYNYMMAHRKVNKFESLLQFLAGVMLIGLTYVVCLLIYVI